MSKVRFSYRKVTALAAVLAITMILGVNGSRATGPAPRSVATPAVDLSSEIRTLDSFVNDLGKFDGRDTELSKKSSLSQSEFDSQQRTADDLKRRVSSVQDALSAIIAKLKAAGEFDNLDQTLLAKVSDQKFQARVRSDGFKKTLEEGASSLTSDAKEISNPLDALRRKVVAQNFGFDSSGSGLAFRTIRTAYNPEPPLAKASFRCRLAFLRAGVMAAVGASSHKANTAMACNCLGSAAACDELSTL